MTDNEIIKALNYCCGNIKNNDEECNEDMCYQVTLPESRDEGTRFCRQWLIKDALDLINRQNAEIENLQKNIDGLNIFTKNHIKVIKLQAMKEFAEKLKRKATVVHKTHSGKHWYEIDDDEIDNIVK